MCGIAGLIDIRQSVAPAQLAERLGSMMRLVRHRGPDDWGMALFLPNPAAAAVPNGERVTLVASRSAALLGHRRLSIIDLSEAARQPMRSCDGSLWVTFNGEIYNYLELRQELAGGYQFRTHSDTEVILAAYQKWGADMLDRFDGMFAFALYDAAREVLFCARDPLGIKPFYYAQADGLFSFASETRAVLAGIASRGRIDPVRTSEFLVLGISDHDEGTCYAEVQQLAGGHWLMLDTTGAPPKIVRYWSPPSETAPTNGQVPARLYVEIRNAVERQLRSDVPVGSCLSGGLDSGAISAAVGHVLDPAERRRYSALTLTTAGFAGDESRLAHTTATRAGLSWVPVEIAPSDVVVDIKKMVGAHDQPFSSLSMFGQFCVMKRARELGLKVMLDGQGGDEIFLGYERVAQRSLVHWAGSGHVVHALAEWLRLQRNASISLAASLRANVAYARPSIVHARNRARMRPLVSADLADSARPHIADEMYGLWNGGVLGLQRRELLNYSLPKLLRFEDRNSMAFGVEARVPLLAKNIVEHALRLPLEWRVHDGWTKYALRKSLEPHLPAEVVWNRRKRGFEVPQKQWVEAIQPWLRDELAATPRDLPVRVDTALAMVGRGQGGLPHLWRALSVAIWIRMNDVGY